MHLETRLLRYKHCRNKICTLVRVSKRRYYDTLFENNMANMKKTWQGINELLHRRKKIKSHIDLYLSLKDFNNRTKIAKDGSRILNILNEHFATIGNRLANNLP